LKNFEPPCKLTQKNINLLNCPIHRWRSETGIELVHKEPTLKELQRIYRNWNLMNEQLKKLSDQKSLELFGKTNEQHYKDLLNHYQKI